MADCRVAKWDMTEQTELKGECANSHKELQQNRGDENGPHPDYSGSFTTVYSSYCTCLISTFYPMQIISQ